MVSAGGAGAIQLHQSVTRVKAGFLSGFGERLGDGRVFDFRHGPAFAADQELHFVIM